MKKIISVLFTCCALSGCLKSKIYEDYSGIQPSVVNPLSNWPSKTSFASPAVDSALGTTSLKVLARYSYRTAPDKAITVIFKRDDSVSIAYNAAFGTNYKLLPDSCFQAGNLRATLGAGAMQTALPVTLFPAKYNGIDNYIISFSIVGADGAIISSNFKSMVFTLKGAAMIPVPPSGPGTPVTPVTPGSPITGI